MESLKDLYNSIENPFNDDAIRYVINGYSNGNNVYSHLTRGHVNEKKYVRQFFKETKDNFYAKLYRIWKNNFLTLDGSKSEEVRELQEFIKDKDITTKADFLHLVYSSEKSELMEKYCWNSIGAYSGWTHVSSKYLTAMKMPSFPVEHRLYLNTNSTYTEKLCSIFMDKCHERNLPFYFKYDESGNRDDTIVIYSDTEKLREYIQILEEIKKENKDLEENVYRPPILTGKIDNWIGYGAEPEPLPNGEKTSFNSVRSDIFEESIKNRTNRWIYDHQNDLINYNGQKITLTQYMTIGIVNRIEKEYLKLIKDKSESEIYNKYGLKKEDFTSGKFRQIIGYYVNENMSDAIMKNINNTLYKETMVVPTREDKKLIIPKSHFYLIFRAMAEQIVNHDSTFFDTIKNDIITESKKCGIDTEKYCFDISTRDKLFAFDEKEKNIAENPNVEIENNRPMEKDDGVHITKETISSHFDESILKETIEYDNNEMTLREYIEDYVFPFIPEDGWFTLKNKSRIPYQQYIEEFVIPSCKERKYNCDISRILADTTINNSGQIIMESGTNSVSFDTVNIVDIFDKDTLNKDMKYPNGATTKAYQYMQEYLAPFIPENGIIILKDGRDISIKKYIEEYIMKDGQIKYNGDIAKLLNDTTRKNHGVISYDRNKQYSQSNLANRYTEEIENNRRI